MDLSQITANGYILALFIRDDEERFLLGTGFYQFKQKQLHFSANAMANDVMEVQGNDGYLLAGQVRRPGVQSFDGYVGDGTTSKADVENYRRDFFRFFRKNYFYKVVYIFPNGKAIQRKRGFIVDDATVKELYQMYPEYHVALNFEDVNYYTYSEDGSGQEIYAEEADIPLTLGRPDGGLVWDAYGAVSNQYTWGGIQTVTGSDLTITNSLTMPAPYSDVKLLGIAGQKSYSGKNLMNYATYDADNGRIMNMPNLILPVGTFTISFNLDSFTLGTASNAGLSLYLIDENNQSTFSDGSGSKSIMTIDSSTQLGRYSLTFETKAITHYNNSNIRMQATAYNNGARCKLTNIQIETGSTATTYEPYVGGQPSPSPSYPQTIDVATGVQNVWVHGKNMWDPSSVLTGVELNSSGAQNPNASRSTLDYTVIKPETNYTLSGASYKRVCFYDESKAFISGAVANANTYSFTSPANTAYIMVSIDNTVTFDNAQLEKNATATTYESYQGAIYTIDLGATELARIGTGYDDIRYTGGHWVKYEAIGKATDSVGSTGITIPNMAQNSPVLSYCGGTVSGKTITYTEALTVANTIYYIKSNATGTTITDAGLIAQLDAFRNSKLAVGTNFISITPASGTGPLLQLSYYTTVTTDGAGYEWEAGTSGGATVVEVDSIENVYPVWELQGPATNPTLTILSTNTAVTYNGTVSATQKLVVDMFNKTATLNGASVIGNISGDWVYMEAGNNRISYTTANSDAPDSKIYWQEIVG